MSLLIQLPVPQQYNNLTCCRRFDAVAPAKKKMLVQLCFLVCFCSSGLPWASGSAALPSLIAAAPMEVAVVEQLQKRRIASLSAAERQMVDQLNNNINDLASKAGEQWPPPNHLLRRQTAKTRARIQCRDNDIIIVSFPKVRF